MNAALISFLQLISACALGQEPDPDRIDPAERSSTIDSLIEVAHRYRFVNLDTAVQAGKQALDFARKAGDKERACDASVAIGLAELFRLYQDRALQYGLDIAKDFIGVVCVLLQPVGQCHQPGLGHGA